jgi:hypothetical protein
LLQPNLIKGVKKPPQRHRDRVLTPEERQEILRTIPDRHFREFVIAMQETGAREPSSMRHVGACTGLHRLDPHNTPCYRGREWQGIPWKTWNQPGTGPNSL